VLKFGLLDTKSATAANFNYQRFNCLPFSRVELIDATGSGQTLIDIEDFVAFSCGPRIAETSFQDLMSEPSEYIQGATSGNLTSGVGRSNSAITSASAARMSSAATNTPSLNYTEQKYIVPGGANQDIYRKFEIKLGSMLPYTFAALEEDLYFPSKLHLRLTWAAGNEYSHQGTSGVDPTTGAAVKTEALAVSDLQLDLCVQDNNQLSDRTKQLCGSSNGYKLPVPSVAQAKQVVMPNAATSYSPQVELTAADGLRLRRMLEMTGPAAPVTAVDYANFYNLAGEKIKQYTVVVNSKPETSQPIDCETKFEDYEINKEYIRNSVFQDRKSFQNGGVYSFRYDGQAGPGEPRSSIDKLKVVGGYDLSKPMTWMLKCNSLTSAAYAFHFWPVVQRELWISAIGARMGPQYVPAPVAVAPVAVG
jgi:hypothetical protein